MCDRKCDIFLFHVRSIANSCSSAVLVLLETTKRTWPFSCHLFTFVNVYPTRIVHYDFHFHALHLTYSQVQYNLIRLTSSVWKEELSSMETVLEDLFELCAQYIFSVKCVAISYYL
jgi:hypothetical protein